MQLRIYLLSYDAKIVHAVSQVHGVTVLVEDQGKVLTYSLNRDVFS